MGRLLSSLDLLPKWDVLSLWTIKWFSRTCHLGSAECGVAALSPYPTPSPHLLTPEPGDQVRAILKTQPSPHLPPFLLSWDGCCNPVLPPSAPQ